MSDPFIIWTMRRTGGTTFASLLMGMSEHEATEHEPFNPDRRLGWVTQGWHQSQDRARLKADMETALERRPVIKHCYELMPPALNRQLMQTACEKGYRHLVLERRAEADRILSLELAKQTGVWGKNGSDKVYCMIESGEMQMAPIDIASAMGHMATCQKMRKDLAAMFAEFGQTPHVMFFEDIYRDPEAGRAEVRAALDFVGIDPAGFADYEQRLTKALLHSGQNTARIIDFVPNIDAARDSLSAAHASYDFSF